MSLPVNKTNSKNSINFSADGNEKDKKALKYHHETILKNNLATRTDIAIDKLTNAFTVYIKFPIN